jgi:hypothetical protein
MTENPFAAELVPFPVQNNLPGVPPPPEVKRALVEQFNAAVERERQRRGEVVRPADVWPMVRAVEAFRDLVDSYARALTDTSKTAKQVLEEELFEAQGEQDGIPRGSLQVPDGGSLIKVSAKTDNAYDFDRGQVMAALAALVESEWQADPNLPDPAADPGQFAAVVSERALDMVGAAALKVTHVRALAARLGHAGHDALAQVVTDAINKRRIYKGVQVDRVDDARMKREAS